LTSLTIIGGGWAGLSAAVHAVQAGWRVRLLEAAPQTGGRARRVMHQGLALDNGQHILIGAYRDTLALMRTVGIDADTCLLRLTLNLLTPDGRGVSLPDLPAPFNVLVGIAGASGWRWGDKWAFMRRAVQWQHQTFDCSPELTVADLCQGLPPVVMASLIEPLCVSALNLPAIHASAKVFLRVLKDALMSGHGSSDMLLPRVDQSKLLPDAAVQWLKQHGAEVLTGHHVDDLSPYLNSPVLLACPSWEASRLTKSLHPAWAAQAAALQHTSIATVYLRANTDMRWPVPVMALPSNPQAPAQFAFDKGRLSQDPSLQGVLALVVSACETDRDAVSTAVWQQAREQLGLPQATLLLTVLEKRAAFACTPGLVRPPMRIDSQLLACGDYVEGPYPSTLEGAVKSGIQAVTLLQALRMRENTV
jgi:hydroxysqualene dehydroxylase